MIHTWNKKFGLLEVESRLGRVGEEKRGKSRSMSTKYWLNGTNRFSVPLHHRKTIDSNSVYLKNLEERILSGFHHTSDKCLKG